jgi:hypothetical protein
MFSRSALLTLWTREFAGGSGNKMWDANHPGRNHLQIHGEEDRGNCETAENYTEKFTHILFVENWRLSKLIYLEK